MSIPKSIDVKLNIRPIYIALVHKYVFEGPCRFGEGEQLTTAYDQMMEQQAYKDFKDSLALHMPADLVHLMDPIYVERNEEFFSPEEMFETMAKDSEEVDLYFIHHSIGRGDLVIEFARRIRKPVMISPEACCNVTQDIAPMKAYGLECYGYPNWDKMDKHIRALRARKALQKTNVLLAPRMNSTISKSSFCTFLNLDDVTERFGTQFRYINVHELMDMTQPIDPTTNYTLPGRTEYNINEDDMKEIRRITEDLVANASDCAMTTEMVENSVRAFYTVKKMLDVRDCNAFSIPCPDLCSTRRINNERFTFCLNHSLMNELGIPSACDYDVGCLLSMAALMNVSMCAPYMGNANPVPYKDGIAQPAPGLRPQDLEPIKELPNLYNIHHAVPNRKLQGLNTPDSEYNIQPFAFSGFGATIRRDFNKDAGQTITMCRFSPNADMIFVAKGTIVGGGGTDIPNCTQNVTFQVADAEDFFKKHMLFGNHLPIVYGDYTEELEELGEILGLKVITA